MMSVVMYFHYHIQRFSMFAAAVFAAAVFAAAALLPPPLQLIFTSDGKGNNYFLKIQQTNMILRHLLCIRLRIA